MLTQMVQANGIRQCYETHGRRGPWVTLVHGSADNHRAWEMQVPALAGRYRVLAYDVRGHGETETPDAPMDQSTFVQDLRGLLDTLNIRRTALVGYSMGGGIVRNFAAAYPERIWALVLSNGGRLDPPPDPAREAEMAKMRQERVAAIRQGGMGSVFDGWLDQIYTPEFAAARPEVVAWHRKITASNDPEKYIRTMSAAFSRAPVDLKRIAMPTLVIVGAGDPYTGPKEARELAKALPRAEVSVFPTRHGSSFERHEEYNRTLRAFFERARPRRGR